MIADIDIIKGIHPGIILERELAKRKLKKGAFALSIQEYPQTLVAIIKGKRRINPALSIKLGKALELEEDFFALLQTYYDLEAERKKLSRGALPNLSKLRPVLFWDTELENIDWEKHKKSVIKRAFERGNKEEQEEIQRFYGKEIVNAILTNHG